MEWFFLALTAAISTASTDALSKKAFDENDEYKLAWVRLAYALPSFLLILAFVKIPKLDPTFFLIILIQLPLEIIATILYMKAIKHSPLSLSLPFLAFTPIFLLLTSYILLGERPDKSGFIGVILVCLGGYLLNFSSVREGFLEPIKAIAREKGSRLMLLVAFIYSITSSLIKIAILHSSPFFFAFFFQTTLFLSFTLILFFKSSYSFPYSLTPRRIFFLIGLCYGISVISQNLSLSLANVTYMISVKRTSLIFSVIYGKIFFGEENLRDRLTGVILMVVGIALINL